MRLRNRSRQTPFRRNLRTQQTRTEAVLWSYLRDRRLLGKKFRRQYGIGRYVVDFFCAEDQLVVEVDGDSHFSLAAQYYDQQRTDFFFALGITTVRFTNQEVLQDTEGVLERLKTLLTPTSHLTPTSPHE